MNQLREDYGIRYFILSAVVISFILLIKLPIVLIIVKSYFVKILWCAGWSLLGVAIWLINSREKSGERDKIHSHYFMYFPFVVFVATLASMNFSLMFNNNIRFYFASAFTSLIIGFFGENLEEIIKKLV